MKDIISHSQEGYSMVTAKKQSSFDMDRFENQINSRIGALYGLPEKAEKPVISRDEFTISALYLQLYGDADVATLQKVAEELELELRSHPKISKINIYGKLNPEFRILVDEEKMRSYGLDLQQVHDAIAGESFRFKSGRLKSDDGVIIISSDSQADTVREFASIPLITYSDGRQIFLEEIAQLENHFDSDNLIGRFNSKPSVCFEMMTSKKGHLIEVSRATRRVADEFRSRLPSGLEIGMWGDASIYMQERLSLLASNALQGLIIVFILLALFLNVKLAFWVSAGIPISLAGALIVMGERFMGQSLNDITTFGMIVVLGILVDDAIVVGESVFETRRKLSDPVEGTIAGVHKVSTATVFGCFTTVAAFFPILLIDNDLGKVFASFSLVVIISLLVSLMESKLILPAHLAGIKLEDRGPTFLAARLWAGVQDRAQKFLNYINRRIYRPTLRLALRHRYLTILIFLTMAFSSLFLVYNGWIRTVFFPEVPGQIITINLKMRNGSPRKLINTHVERIEEAVQTINRELGADDEHPPIKEFLAALTGDYTAEFYAEIQPEDKRVHNADTIMGLLKEKVGSLEAVESLEYTSSFETGGGFEIGLFSENTAHLEEASRQLRAALSSLDGAEEVFSSLNQGVPRLQLRLKPQARYLGLNSADIASQIGNGFGGIEVQKHQRSNEEVKVILRFEEEQRSSVHDLMTTRIRTPGGSLVPLGEIALIDRDFIPTDVSRKNGKQRITVSARLDKEKISATEAYKILKKGVIEEIRLSYPDVKIEGMGELEEMGEIQGGLINALIFIIILIYVLLAVPLKSYTQPLVIMSVIPFGFTGAVLAHGVRGLPVNILSLFGMLALMGIVVNDSLVMLTRFNELREEGMNFNEALVQAGGSRFRPIILTTITTVFGLFPLISETSEQAQYLIPAALSVAGGEIFVTPITLIIVPVLIQIQKDISLIVKKLFSTGTSRKKEPMPMELELKDNKEVQVS